MMKVSELSKLSGLSVRTLHYYDKIGLLKPDSITDAGYRVYGEESVERLSQIMFMRELGFHLKDIRGILESPSFDRNTVLEQQIELMKLKREHLDNLITLAEGVLLFGMSRIEFKAFDTKKIDQYMLDAKSNKDKNPTLQEYESKVKEQTREQQEAAANGILDILVELGRLKAEGKAPSSTEAKALVEKLQAHFSENYYACTLQILSAMGKMYTGDGRYQEELDEHGGPGTSRFVGEAIAAYCAQ